MIDTATDLRESPTLAKRFLKNTTPKKTPMLLSEGMAVADRAGRKSQTRRIMKFPSQTKSIPVFEPHHVCKDGIGNWVAWSGLNKASDKYWEDFTLQAYPNGGGFECPYGKPGDQIWIKEAFYAYGFWAKRFNSKKGREEWYFTDETQEVGVDYHYCDNVPEVVKTGRGGHGWYKRSSLFMPREASRMTWEIEDVRAEQLQGISEADAIAEGVEFEIFEETECNNGVTGWVDYLSTYANFYPTARESYFSLWESINGPGSAEKNPWVWVIKYRHL